jgi:uncharacterized protein
MHIFIGLIISVCLFASFHPMQKNPRHEINLDLGGGYPMTIDHNVVPLAEMQERNVIHQEYDFSCGSAALATLLNYYLGENLTEHQVIKGLMEYGDKEKIAARRAFSFLDMKQFVNKLGYKGVGYKAELTDLLELNRPCIIPIEFLGYRHFTVLKGIHDGHIFLADPFRGNTSYPLAGFEDMWYEDVIFVVYPEGAREYDGLKLTNDDLRYVSEDSTHDLLRNYGAVTETANRRDIFNTLPDEYQMYRH